MSVNFEPKTKAIATVADVARLVGLSRARFYQLQQEGVFPLPVYNLRTRRPHYTEEQQRDCLEVRRRNCGINGQPVLFYCRRPLAAPISRRQPAKPKAEVDPRHARILASIKGLGLASATPGDIAVAVKQLFPDGPDQHEEAEVIRAVFVFLNRQSSGDNVGR